jgi:hypothetical protein
VVVTSREWLQIEGEIEYELRQFTTGEAVDLFTANTTDTLSKKDMALLRQDILETLLDKNPLAITLITQNMPVGKQLSVLKHELETDLFAKISEDELGIFDANADLNIARKKSIYGSILYSYKTLNHNEQKAFEILSLFPDGIDLEAFKRLSNNKDMKKADVKVSMITDKVIKALADKSMLENNNGIIKLQSIVGKFAEAKLNQRDKVPQYYQNAFEHNAAVIRGLDNLRFTNQKQALQRFNQQQGNFLKSIGIHSKSPGSLQH